MAADPVLKDLFIDWYAAELEVRCAQHDGSPIGYCNATQNASDDLLFACHDRQREIAAEQAKEL